MALTITNSSTSVWGNKRTTRLNIAFDSLYPTGGESLSLSNLGLSEVDIVLISQKSGYVFEYDYTNKKVLAYRSAGFTPAGAVAAPVFTGSALATHHHDLVFKANAAANAVTMAADSLRNATGGDLTVTGGGADGGIAAKTGGTPAGTNNAPAFTGTAVAAAAMAEVANTTDLSALTGVRVMAIGA